MGGAGILLVVGLVLPLVLCHARPPALSRCRCSLTPICFNTQFLGCIIYRNGIQQPPAELYSAKYCVLLGDRAGRSVMAH